MRNAHLAVYFGRDEEGEVCHLVPSSNIEQAVKDNGMLKYNVEKLFTDIVDKKVHMTQP